MTNYKEFFPLLMRNQELIYLDYAATTPTPQCVINKWVDYQENIGVSAFRGDGTLSKLAQTTFDDSISTILDFFEGDNQYELMLTKNSTEAINLVALGLYDFISRGDIVILGPYEHHSNYLPWINLCRAKGAILVELPLSKDGSIDYHFIDTLELNRVKIISLSLTSNVNSYNLNKLTLQYFREKTNAMIFLDVCQSIGHQSVSFSELAADGYFLSAHKMYGPKQIGAAAINKKISKLVKPIFWGGGMVWSVLGQNLKAHEHERKYLSGTFDIGLLAGWATACKFMSSINLNQIMKHEDKLWEYVNKKIDNSKISIINKGINGHIALCSMDIKNIHVHDMGEIMANNNIIIRTGHLCAQNVLNNLGLISVLRFSWGIATTESDIDKFFKVLYEAI